MDIKFETGEGIFSVRVRALIINDGKLLAMHDEYAPYYYLVGGKVEVNETTEEAVLREVCEELEIEAEIVRPVFFAQNFYTDDVNGKRYHEIVLYYLLDVSKTELLSRGDKFVIHEGKHTLTFEWLNIDGLEDKYLYPNFIKTEVKNLPKQLKFIVEHE
ncbi:MAG: NUDIX domain-containing protein [Clostridia bacterium]|nr:NUDIX domain-containing protein [Clostridia bacterium]